MVNSLRKEVENQLKLCGVSSDAKIVAGVSGGPDSLAMMHILHKILPQGKLVVGHLNHKLREEADAEARFVCRTAESWNIPFNLGEVDVQTLAKREGKSIEEAARKARYDFLLDLAKKEEAQFILVAHHADDQVETVFLNLLRGSGLTGLRGMEQVRSFPDEPGIRLVRPLLFTWREAIHAYCDEHDLQPVLDHSNEDVNYRRNQIRHEVFPLLLQINPGFKHHMQQLAGLVHADEAYLSQQMKKTFEEIILVKDENILRLDRPRWRALPLSLQRRTLRYAVFHFHKSVKDVSFRVIDQACHVAQTGFTGAKSILPGNLTLVVGYHDLMITTGIGRDYGICPQLHSMDIQKMDIPGMLKLDGGWQIAAESIEADLGHIHNNSDPWQAFISIGVDDDLYLRTRKPGERFKPLGMDGRTVSFQDFMVNIKLPAEYRSHWPIVATMAHPVWLVGHRIDERAKVSKKDQQIIHLQCVRIEDSG